MAKMNKQYKQAIWDFTEVLQAELQMESALSTCMEIMKKTIVFLKLTLLNLIADYL